MIKHSYKFALIGATLSVAVLGSASLGALPQKAAAQAQADNSTTAHGTTEANSTQSTQSTDNQTVGQEHLAAAQLKACENRQQAITNIMTRISDRGQKQLTLFTTIATRTETFYTNKGKTLSNYAALVADVKAKEAAAQTAVTAISSTKSTFSCTATNPKGIVSAFQSSLKTEIAALQAYRTSVKNLIVGVKSAQSTTTTSTGTTSTDTSTNSSTNTSTSTTTGGNQ